MENGCVEAIQNAGIATPGVAESFLTLSHITRMRHVNQVISEGLYILEMRVYVEYLLETDQMEASFED